MIEALKKLFGRMPVSDYAVLIEAGALVLDVRSRSEFAEGHIKDSVNIPIDQLGKELDKLDKSRVIITCCASGVRSASAKSLLKSAGFTKVYNAGSWTRLTKKTT